MLVFFYEDSDTITMREYRADNFLEPIHPVIVKEIKYNLCFVPVKDSFVTETDYMAKVIEMAIEGNIIDEMPSDSIPVVLIFFGGEVSLWKNNDVNWILYRYRYQMNVIPAYYKADEVDAFVEKMFHERNRDKCV